MIKTLICDILNRVTLKNFTEKDLDDNLNFYYDLHISSLDVASLIFVLEDNFSVFLKTEEYSKITTIGSLIELFEFKIAQSKLNNKTTNE